MRKDGFLGSERKRRLLHNFICQKMNPECTIFPYTLLTAFLEKSLFRIVRSGGPTHQFEEEPPKDDFSEEKPPFEHFSSN